MLRVLKPGEETVCPARGASPSRHDPITRGTYAPKSRSPDVASIIMVVTQEVNVMQVVPVDALRRDTVLGTVKLWNRHRLN
jgi:hypothetical protein